MQQTLKSSRRFYLACLRRDITFAYFQRSKVQLTSLQHFAARNTSVAEINMEHACLRRHVA